MNLTSSETTLIANTTVLIIDDEELMREVTSIMIEDHGGTALCAADGEEGIEVFRKNQDKVGLVVVDFSMPKMNGYEATVEILKMKPGIGILMVSGLRITPEVQELVNQGSIAFLSKPFHESDLIGALQKLQKRS